MRRTTKATPRRPYFGEQEHESVKLQVVRHEHYANKPMPWMLIFVDDRLVGTIDSTYQLRKLATDILEALDEA